MLLLRPAIAAGEVQSYSPTSTGRPSSPGPLEILFSRDVGVVERSLGVGVVERPVPSSSYGIFTARPVGGVIGSAVLVRGVRVADEATDDGAVGEDYMSK